MKGLLVALLWAVSALALPDECLEELKFGNCTEPNPRKTRYGYNKFTGGCIAYTESECGPTRNKFETREQCEQKCAPDRCSKPLEKGPCAGNLKRYGYDTVTKKCREFTYSGCGGNNNMFETIEECREVCNDSFVEDICALPITAGPCRAQITRYAYDGEQKKCVAFNYGGCRGNENNFQTLASCISRCMRQGAEPTTPETGDRCSLPIDAGPCLAMIPRYAYMSRLGKCVAFTYGGCQGNANNFETQQDCEDSCQNPTSSSKPEDVCSLPVLSGPCRARLLRFTYDKTTKSCVAFYYGGCGGNANNFETLKDCKATCQKPDASVCTQPINVGPCDSLIQRYAYDLTKRSCVPFYYGGCQGNGNNFETRDVCASTCEKQTISVNAKDTCSQPIDLGSCGAQIPRYAYDSTAQKCVPFFYGGCQGNTNNFASKGECVSMCSTSANPEPTEDVCQQDIDRGACTLNMERYAYDKNKKQCLAFTYGGCKGNENNFATMEECTAKCVPQSTGKDICSQPIEPGPCRGSYRRYAYDATSGKCILFAYGGCQGNDNNFLRKNECEQMCLGGEGSEDPCKLPLKAGNCSNFQYRWGYRDGYCVQFLYSGCNGNANNFEALNDCINTCGTYLQYY
ncbi:unnamed protein product [Cylicocyclus nassatus]|uniref:BPTI/Kunitz inhibitor domain-containing protein n=1 Tax=Cylicocyclus nassatus TaxID=53992 RepID=A0AA36MF61_CYLNA|nr:unnamed protein product [Cylicocyclus nassatus]